MACEILVPCPGIEPASPAFQGGFLTTGAPGKSLDVITECCGHPWEPGQTLCYNLDILFPVACDDDCVGVLLNDLGHVGNAILSVNLTSTVPLPYGVLSDLESRTKSLRVGTVSTEMDRRVCHRKLKSRLGP